MTDPLEQMVWLIDVLHGENEECITWPWKRGKQDYGFIRISGVPVMVAVLMCRLAHGPQPAGHFAAHAPGVCHNPPCVNPRHLRWATTTENSFDRWADGTMVYPNSVPAETVMAIRQSTEPGTVLAKRYGITGSTVSKIRNGKSYRGIP